MKSLKGGIKPSVTSILISGGCDKNGKVPILDSATQIKKLKEKFKINAHVGLVSAEEAEKISLLVDAVSFDFVTEPKIIKRIYKLNKKVSDYYDSLSALAGVTKVFPHLTLGLWQGEISWEYEAVKILAENLKLKEIIFNIFIPAIGTEMEKQKIPSIASVKKYFLFLRKNYPYLVKRLGCMRPGGRYRSSIDKIALESGFKVITKPSKKIYKLAKDKNYQVLLQHQCCIFCHD